MHSIRDRLPVSIIIANYNYARFLNRAIDSALSQNHANVEVIVVDDASTDGSAEVISSYGARIKACLRKANGGHAAAFNTGFAESRGGDRFFFSTPTTTSTRRRFPNCWRAGMTTRPKCSSGCTWWTRGSA